MAKTQDMLKEKLDRLESVPDKLISKVQAAEKELLAEINLLMGAFDRDGAGNLLMNQKNLALIQSLKPQLEQIFLGSSYVEAIRDFAGEFDKQASLNKEFYKALTDYTESSELAALTQLNKRKTVGLLLEGAIDSSFYDPIVETMTEAVSTRAPFVETVANIKLITQGGETVAGTEVMGRLSRYAKQISYDAMAVADRAYGRQVTAELGIEFYQFVGGTINDTREFCMERNGGIYHEREVEEWASEDWQGRHRATTSGSIFTLLGGYNCRHSLIPVPLSQVPLPDLQRNLRNGNLKLNQKQRDILGV